MYKIAIVFRRTAQPNIFREIILNALSANFSDYLICSAFFQETQTTKNPFSTSKEIINTFKVKIKKCYFFPLNIKMYTIYNFHKLPCVRTMDLLFASAPRKTKEINIYGVYSSGRWTKQFKDCSMSLLEFSKIHTYLKFKFFKFKNKSHSKVFYAKNDGTIELAIIGSSNLSAGAFADRSQKQSWNHESDVIFWKDDELSLAKKVIDKIFKQKEIIESYSILIANYDEEHKLNRGKTILDRLDDIEKLFNDHSKELPI